VRNIVRNVGDTRHIRRQQRTTVRRHHRGIIVLGLSVVAVARSVAVARHVRGTIGSGQLDASGHGLT